MDYEKCKALICSIDYGKLSLAAQHLDVTTSTVSKMITSLEQETGLKLLNRTRDGVTPTDSCLKLLDDFRKFVYDGSILEQKSSHMNGIDYGRVNIGVAHRFYYKWLAHIVKGFKELYPNIDIQIYHGYSTFLLNLLEKRSIDVCIISKREGQYNWIHLMDDPMVAMISCDNPLSKKDRISLDVFEKEKYVCSYPNKDTDSARVFRKYNIHPNIQLSTSDSYAAYTIIDEGLGISLETKSTAQFYKGKNVKLIPIRPSEYVPIGIATNKEITPATQTFINYVYKHLPEEL